jgi:hypothetical protein
LRYDEVLQQIFGWSNAPSQSTYSRFFHKFSPQLNNTLFPELQQWFMQLWQYSQPLTLDLDSTVITRYGQQEGAAKGYNPQKPGRKSHHPLMAFVPEGRFVVNAWLRKGNAHDASGFQEFMYETLAILNKADKRVGLLRADSGFFTGQNLEFLERRGLHYIVAVPLYPHLRQRIATLKEWYSHAEGLN